MANDNIQQLTNAALEAFEQSWWGNMPGEKKDGMYIGVLEQIEAKQTDALTPRKAAYNLLVLFREADGDKDKLLDKRIDKYSEYLKSLKEITSEADRLALLAFKKFMEATLEPKNLEQYGRNSGSFVRSIVQSKIREKTEASKKLIQDKIAAYSDLAKLEERAKQHKAALKQAKNAELEKELESLEAYIAEIQKAEAEKQKAAQQQDLRPVIAELKEFRGKIQYADDSYIRQLRSGANFADDKKYSPAAQAHLKQIFDQVHPKAEAPVEKRGIFSTVFHTVVGVATQGVTMAVTKGSSIVAPYLGTPDLEKNADDQFKRDLGLKLDAQIEQLNAQARLQYRSRVESDTAELMKAVKEQPVKVSWFQRARQFVSNGWNSVKKLFELRTLDKLVDDIKSTPIHKLHYDILQKFLIEAARVKTWLKDDEYRLSIVKAAERLSESADRIFQTATKQKQLSSTSQAQALLSAPVATPASDNQSKVTAQQASKADQFHAQQARAFVVSRFAKTAPAGLFSASAATAKQKSACSAVTSATLRRIR